MLKIHIFLFLLFNILNFHSALSAKLSHDSRKIRNDRPIIGILAQERTEDESVSFIGAPYITHMASSGARVVPIFVRRDESYYRQIIAETNGLLLPGGDRNIMDSDFQRASQILFRLITEANDRGARYPIYGVCQGMEMVTVLILEQWLHDPNPFWLTSCSSEDQAINLRFLDDPRQSRMFRNVRDDVISTLTTKNVIPDFHHLCLTPGNFSTSGLDTHLRIISTSNDTRGLEFVSTLESVNDSRPIYLIQWHPENILSEFKIVEGEQESIRHTPSAVAMTQYIGNFIVGEARKNMNRFESTEGENKALIYNCHTIYTMGKEEKGKFGREPFTQFYSFPTEGDCQAEGSTMDQLIHLNFLVIGIVLLIILGISLRICLGVFLGGKDSWKDNWIDMGYSKIP